MKAARIHKFGHADIVMIEDIPRPTIKKDHVLIEVYASSINPIDSAIREGALEQMTPLTLPLTLGYDLSGVVEEVGEGVKGFNVGDKVYGQASILSGGSGAFAQYTVTHSDHICKIPSNISFIEAAVIGLTGTSALEALLEHIQLSANQKILIHGGAGGIGTIAIQIAKYIGAYVATTATNDGMPYASKLGANEVIDYKNESFEERLFDYDAVLDTVGGETYAKSFKILKKGGVILSMIETPDDKLMKQFEVKAMYQGTNVNTQHLTKLKELIEEGIVTVHVDKSYPIDQIQDAFVAKENEHVHGKIGVEIKIV